MTLFGRGAVEVDRSPGGAGELMLSSVLAKSSTSLLKGHHIF
jgi:hypothetical protein